MRDVIIDPVFFSAGNTLSAGLISGLKRLSVKGLIPIVPVGYEIPGCFAEILELENITMGVLNRELAEFAITESADLKAQKVIAVNSDDVRTFSEAVDFILRELRRASLRRKTHETEISITAGLDGTGKHDIQTGIGFFDHMLEQIARHGNMDLIIEVKGDLHVDEHHTVEDTGIALGEVLLKALGDKRGIRRYGFLLPMDDAETKISIDLGGRFYLDFQAEFARETVGEFPTELTEEFFRGLASGLKATIHIDCRGKNDHHKIESIFKAFAKALNEACRIDERAQNALPSTKGLL